MKQGKGKYFYINGNVFDGDWINDKKNGDGTYTYFSTGEKYVGKWVNGEREGIGILIKNF